MQNITEEDKIHEEWYKEAKKMTMEELPTFLKKLTEEYGHDYGTICHAISASAIAAAWAVERTPQGGITGFQAGCIMWGFITNWMSYNDEALALIKYDNMLYPQCEDKFTTISKSTWEWLQKKAKKNLECKENVHQDVIKHWESIVGGIIPFGYTIGE